MTYTVVWKFTALQQLQAVTAAAIDPAAVRQAAVFVDYALRRAPLDMGESRTGNARLWYWDVLGVYYKVDDVAMRVEVLLIAPARRS